jgi:hypothetical protein
MADRSGAQLSILDYEDNGVWWLWFLGARAASSLSEVTIGAGVITALDSQTA